VTLSTPKNAQKGRTDGETGKALLLRVLEELKDLKDASKKQGELISQLHGQLGSSQQELRDTKNELKTVREQLEALATTIALSQSSPHAAGQQRE
jgi:chromosome segregation ATPase